MRVEKVGEFLCPKSTVVRGGVLFSFHGPCLLSRVGEVPCLVPTLRYLM